jgi:hypothetical protein
MGPLDAAEQMFEAVVWWGEQWLDAIATERRRTAPARLTSSNPPVGDELDAYGLA